MSPQQKSTAKTLAEYATFASLVIGAIGTYAATREKVDRLSIDQREAISRFEAAQHEQIKSNERVAERLTAIETELQIRRSRTAQWADRDRTQEPK